MAIFRVQAKVVQPISVSVEAKNAQEAENMVKCGEIDVVGAMVESCGNGGHGDVEVIEVEEE